MSLEWYSGTNNYQKMSFVPGESINTFTLELKDVEQRPFGSIKEVFADHLSGASLPVEVLYSGGIDSECALLTCLNNNIPVHAITLRLLIAGCPLNIVDLYYAEKFCREHGIRHIIYDLEIDKFVENGDHNPYLEKYQVDTLGSIVVQWLIEQCHSFPVVGGDYTWPELGGIKPTFSTKKYSFNMYDLFMRDNGIPGIGNFIGNSIESNNMFVREHVRLYKETGSLVNIKPNIMASLGFDGIEPRIKSTGWELLSQMPGVMNREKIITDFSARIKPINNVIKWNQSLAALIMGVPGSNESVDEYSGYIAQQESKKNS